MPFWLDPHPLPTNPTPPGAKFEGFSGKHADNFQNLRAARAASDFVTDFAKDVHHYKKNACGGASVSGVGGAARGRLGPLGAARDRSGPLGTARDRSGPAGTGWDARDDLQVVHYACIMNA